MISERMVCKYCKDDISLIENYNKAKNDKSQQWDCHHKLEITLNCGVNELKDKNLYYNRPASELIFLTHSEHASIHKAGENSPSKDLVVKQKIRNSLKDKPKSKEHKKHLSESHKGYIPSKEQRTKQSETMKDMIWIYKDNNVKRVKSEILQQYLNIGYKLGRKPK